MASKRDGISISLNPRVAVTCQEPGRRLPVFITPLAPTQVSPPEQCQRLVKKLLLKAVSKKAPKTDSKVFCLRNVNLSSVKELKKLISGSFCDDITSKDFDVGYMQGSNVIRIRTKDDIEEFHSLVDRSQNNAVCLWCDGLRLSKKRDSGDDSDDDMPKSKKARKNESSERDKEVEDCLKKLKDKHGSQFTPMQLRIWAEMRAVGQYMSLETPPTTSMFLRAGGDTRKKNESSKTTTTSINSVSVFDSNGSPAKRIENRAKLYKQLAELKNLRDAGVLSNEEYCLEKEAIMDFLKQLNGNQ